MTDLIAVGGGASGGGPVAAQLAYEERYGEEARNKDEGMEEDQLGVEKQILENKKQEVD